MDEEDEYDRINKALDVRTEEYAGKYNKTRKQSTYLGGMIYCKHCGTRFTVDQIQAICTCPPGYKIDAYKR